MINKFVQTLLANPNFVGQPLSVVEMHISNFVAQNQANLSPLLTGPNFFPDASPQEATEKLLVLVRRTIAGQVLAQVKNALPNINFDIHRSFDRHFDISVDDLRNNFISHYEKIIAHREARQRIEALTTILEERLIEKYITAAFEEKSYIYNELFRVEKHHLESPHLIEFLKFCAAMAPGYFIKLNAPEIGLVGQNAYDLREKPAQQQKYFTKADQIMKSMLGQIVEDFWDTAKSSLLDYNENPNQNPGGKFLAIMFMRARDYRKGIKVEKGAETPDKSWFSIQIRNVSFTGLDKDMLENLNRIAFAMKY